MQTVQTDGTAHVNFYKPLVVLPMEVKDDPERNSVFLHNKDVEELFGPSFAKVKRVCIGEFIYDVAIRNIFRGAIFLNSCMQDEIKNKVFFLESRRWVLVAPSLFEPSLVDEISFKILATSYDQPLDYGALEKLCKKKLQDKIVNISQTFLIDGEKLKVQVEAFKADVLHGLVSDKTSMVFKNMIPHTQLLKSTDAGLHYCSFTVHLKFHENLEEPNLVCYDQFIDTLYEELMEGHLFQDCSFEIKYKDLLFHLSVVELKGELPPKAPPPFNYYNGMLLREDTKIELFSDFSELIFFKKDLFYLAQSAKFKIVEGTHHKSWIDKKSLNLAVRQKKLLIEGQTFKVVLSTGTYLLTLESAEKSFFETKEIEDAHLSLPRSWKFEPAALFEFEINASLKVQFVDSEEPHKMTKVTFEVASINSFEVLESDLEEAARKYTSPFLEGDTFKVTILQEEFSLKIDKTYIEGGGFYLGELQPASTMSFTVKKGALLSIIPKLSSLDLDLPKALKELGFGGLDKPVDDLMRKVMAFYDPVLKNTMKQLDILPPKGAVFYGPPGTGKTTLARALPKFLGCQEERVAFICASEIFSKYLGASEKKIRALFERAALAEEKYGDKSPLFMVIIDEFETIAAKRDDEDAKWAISIVNQLLAAIDGRASSKNVFMIGITNRFDLLDPAILRPGRLEVHLEIGLPDLKGRAEILDIYTKKQRDSHLLDDKIDFLELSKQAQGLSGADLQGLVKNAFSYYLQRLLKGEKGDKVMMEDFRRALAERKQDQLPWYQSMYG